MTTKFLDMTGKTEDEAIAKALAQLGLDRDEVSVEILERAKKGFLGIGAAQAKVRVTYEVPDGPVQPVMKPTGPPPPPPKPSRTPPVPPEERPVRPERPARPERKKAPRPPKPEREAAVPGEAAEPPAPPPVDLGEPCGDETAGKITAFLTGLLEHMGSQAQVKVYYHQEENRYKVILEGEKLGALIGRRGETLDAIQQLTNYSVNRGSDKRVRIHVDAENYRLKREVPNVTTYSMGTDPNRRVIVAYDRSAAR